MTQYFTSDGPAAQNAVIPPTGKHRRSGARDFKHGIRRISENPDVQRLSEEELKVKVREKYNGPQGALLKLCSNLSLHTTWVERLVRKGKFNLRGLRQILDVGCGAGQITSHLLKYADPEVKITSLDFSAEMLRARARIHDDRPLYVSGDITALPFADNSFDALTCGYVLEHLKDPRPGLREMHRVLSPGGRVLLLATEYNFTGVLTGHLWCCRTFVRDELQAFIVDAGFRWNQDLWFTRVHKVFRAGGICCELIKDS